MSDEYLWNRTGDPDPDELMLEELLPRIKDRTRRTTEVRAVQAASPTSGVAPRRRLAWMMTAAAALLTFALGLVLGMSLRAPSAAPLAGIEDESSDKGPQPPTKVASESLAAPTASRVRVDTTVPVPRRPRPSPLVSPLASTKTSAALAASAPPRTLSPKEIRMVISRHQGELQRRCWSSIPDAQRKSASVRVSLTIVVSSDGRVSTADASSAPEDYSEVGRCVAGQARGWRFPQSSTSTTLSVPLVFAHN